jgi:hypothetical protein
MPQQKVVDVNAPSHRRRTARKGARHKGDCPLPPVALLSNFVRSETRPTSSACENLSVGPEYCVRRGRKKRRWSSRRRSQDRADGTAIAHAAAAKRRTNVFALLLRLQISFVAKASSLQAAALPAADFFENDYIAISMK